MNKTKPTMANWYAILISLLYIANPISLFAASGVGLMPLTVKVTLWQETCDITGKDGSNQPITVDFEDIVALRIDGIAYEKPIPYKVNCKSSSSNPALWVSLSGTGTTAFNSQLLPTSDPQLGLKIQSNGQVVTPGQRINFNYEQPPSLSATPVVGKLSALVGGKFTATATLNVDYQ